MHAPRGTWRRLDDVGFAMLEWVAWFNTCCLLEPLGYLPQPSLSSSLNCKQQ